MTDPVHIPVLLDEVVQYLDPQPGQVLLDGTLGRGGHARELIPRLAPGGTYLGLDCDPGNAAAAESNLRPIAEAAGVTLHVRHANFATAGKQVEALGAARINGVLVDLGFASNQVDDPGRGFSFQHDGPLDMRLNPDAPTTAAQLVNTMQASQLADVIYQYGEERMSRRIARKIVESRENEPITTTSRLAAVVRSAFPASARGRIDPATRTFQALRIAVNGELAALDRLLAQAPGLLASGGRLAVIAFHSLEDRPVKQAMQRWKEAGLGEPVTRKPMTATEAEIAANGRSRSAKLRVFLFTPRRDS